MERLLALDAVAMSSVGLLFGWVASLASPAAARDMRADALAMFHDAVGRLRG